MVKVICKIKNCVYCNQSGKQGKGDEFTCGNDEITISASKGMWPTCEEFEPKEE